MWDQFTTDDQAAALRLDALASSHPIQVPIAHAEEVEEVFDMISYAKGASVIRMIHAVLGPEAFQKGLQIYMKRHECGNTVTGQLWAAWAEASGKPIVEIMSNWTNQMGFPLLHVEESATPGKLKLRQTWFLADGSTDPAAGGAAKLWAVPLLTTCGDAGTTPVTGIFDAAEGEVDGFAGASSWVKLNGGQELPLRVLYSGPMRAKLLSGLYHKTLPPADRAGLVGDYSAICKAGKATLGELLEVVEAAAHAETSYTVWEALEQAISGLGKVLGEDPAMEAAFDTKVSALASSAFGSVGFEPKPTDGHQGTMLRGLLIRLLGGHGAGPEVLAEARRRFDLLVADPTNAAILPADYKTPVFKMVLKSCGEAGGEAEYNSLMDLYSVATDNAEKKHVFMALGAAPSAALKQRTLDWAISGEIKLQDFFYPMVGVSGSGKLGSEMSFEFFKSNFGKLKEMLAAASPSLMSAVIVYSECHCSPHHCHYHCHHCCHVCLAN